MPDSGFRARLLAQTTQIGSFLKIPSTQPAEILGRLGFDFVVIDEEHAPLNRETTDLILLACRAAGMAGLVRVRTPADILSVLDAGADGVLVPHVTTPDIAREVVAQSRYRGGKRGFSPTTRAGDFGAHSMSDHIRSQDERVAVIAMIEDADAIDQIDAIVTVDGLDAIFLGRGDLAASLGLDAPAEALQQAVDRILVAAARARLPVMALASTPEDAADLAARGVSAFLVSSDQGFLRSAASASRQRFLSVLASGAHAT